jgi:hypothetical protein
MFILALGCSPRRLQSAYAGTQLMSRTVTRSRDATREIRRYVRLQGLGDHRVERAELRILLVCDVHSVRVLLVGLS